MYEYKYVLCLLPIHHHFHHCSAQWSARGRHRPSSAGYASAYCWLGSGIKSTCRTDFFFCFYDNTPRLRVGIEPIIPGAESGVTAHRYSPMFAGPRGEGVGGRDRPRSVAGSARSRTSADEPGPPETDRSKPAGRPRSNRSSPPTGTTLTINRNFIKTHCHKVKYVIFLFFFLFRWFLGRH